MAKSIISNVKPIHSRFGTGNEPPHSYARLGRLQRASCAGISGAKRVTNKRPDNFLYLGLIKSLFPNALIINTCASLWTIVYRYSSNHWIPDWIMRMTCIRRLLLPAVVRRVMAHWQQPHIAGGRLSLDEPQQTIAGVLSFLQLTGNDDDCHFHFHRLRNRYARPACTRSGSPCTRVGSLAELCCLKRCRGTCNTRESVAK